MQSGLFAPSLVNSLQIELIPGTFRVCIIKAREVDNERIFIVGKRYLIIHHTHVLILLIMEYRFAVDINICNSSLLGLRLFWALGIRHQRSNTIVRTKQYHAVVIKRQGTTVGIDVPKQGTAHLIVHHLTGFHINHRYTIIGSSPYIAQFVLGQRVYVVTVQSLLG